MEDGISEVNLFLREADIAIRATHNPPDTSLGRKVCEFRFCIYALLYGRQEKDLFEGMRIIGEAKKKFTLN